MLQYIPKEEMKSVNDDVQYLKTRMRVSLLSDAKYLGLYEGKMTFAQRHNNLR